MAIGFRDNFKKQIIPSLKKELGFDNNLAVPKLEKIIVNTGIGKMLKDARMVEKTAQGLALVTGQKPVPTKAKKAISAFKIREDMHIGFKVTLRNQKMYDFFERLIKIVLPRIRDFSGINPKSFDKNGNLTIGIKESSSFPEASKKMPDHIFSLEITLVTNAKKREAAIALIKAFGVPIKESVS